jgi:hypothetical protein
MARPIFDVEDGGSSETLGFLQKTRRYNHESPSACAAVWTNILGGSQGAVKTIVSATQELMPLMVFLPPAAGNQIWRVANKTGRAQNSVQPRVFSADRLH